VFAFGDFLLFGIHIYSSPLGFIALKLFSKWVKNLKCLICGKTQLA